MSSVTLFVVWDWALSSQNRLINLSKSLQHKQISSVLKRTGISRTPDSVTNTMIAMMEFQRNVFVQMV